MKDVELNDVVGYWYIDAGNPCYSITQPNTIFAKVKFYNNDFLIYYEISIYNIDNKHLHTQHLTFKQHAHTNKRISEILENGIFKLLKTRLENNIDSYKIHIPRGKVISRNI